MRDQPFNLPPNTVQFSNDGGEPPRTALLQDAEREYRKSYLAAAREVVTWDMPDPEVIDEAWKERKRVKREAEVLVPSSFMFGNPNMDSEQIVYRAGHEIEFSRTRGRVQALELAKQYWWALGDVGFSDEEILEQVMKPWLADVEEWAKRPIIPDEWDVPTGPDDFLTEAQRQMMEWKPMTAVKPQSASSSSITAKSVRQLLNEHPRLRRAVIHELLREGETMNVIASPKVGKSWLVTDLALAVATGRKWLDWFDTEPGHVLIVDNELHRETTANRIPKVMKARGIPLDAIAERVFVENVRGGLKDIFGLGSYFETLTPGRFKLIVLDAFYRFMPKDTDENDNGTMSQVYNHLDSYAAKLGCSFVLVHHSAKGNQSGKSVTDVGAGAGSQSRATDTHLVLRPHEEPDCVVLDAAVRSWPPIEPRVLRWTFPVWTPDDLLDPAALRPERPRRKAKTESESSTAPKATEPAWDASRFVQEFVTDDPTLKLALFENATTAGLSERKATKLLKQAEAQGLVHRWKYGSNEPIRFSRIPQPTTAS